MAAINDLIAQVSDDSLREKLEREVNKLSKQKKFGLVFESHLPEVTPLYDMPIRTGSKVILRDRKDDKNIYVVLKIENEIAECVTVNGKEQASYAVNELVRAAEFGETIYPYLKPIDSVCNAPENELWHSLIEADNYHALQLLDYLYAGKVDCIYIDPPYNTGARDWKYNNDYVDGNDSYRHSKWLSFIQRRLKIAKKLLNPNDSVLIVTIDEKEYLHLGCLLEEMFPEANIQMIVDVINPRGTNRENEFSRVEEYIFICRFGQATISKSEDNMMGNTDETRKGRVWDSFNRSNNLRFNHNNQFFPIYIDEVNRRIVSVGEAMDKDCSQNEFPQIDGLTAVFPTRSDGRESSWRAIPSTTREWIEKGYVKIAQFDKKTNRWQLNYIPSGLQKRIENGEIKVPGKKTDGSLDIQRIDSVPKKVAPKTVWNLKEHNATDYGITILNQMLDDRSFAYPKSLYSVFDTLHFFVADKPNALVVDFFAGSGTTLHALNLINAEDGGHRRGILITNNEVSENEAKSLSKQGLSAGDDEWDKHGIAQNVTWPRTKCSILGCDRHGKKLKGKYLKVDRAMDEGFESNAIFFKLSFLDKTAVALGMQFKELLPVLWMKAGAIGKCPEIEKEDIPNMLILPQNKFAVLIDENYFAEFEKQVRRHPEIQMVFIVTDYEVNYRSMVKSLDVKETSQLYRDYLDNFRINHGRN